MKTKVERALALWKSCVESSNWPAHYSTQIAYAEPRPWELADTEVMETENREKSDE